MRIALSASAAMVDDLRILQLKPILDIDRILEEHQIEISKFRDGQKGIPNFEYPLTKENCNVCFQNPPTGLGRKAQLSLMTVDGAVGGMDEWAKQFCQDNRGWLEFSVASIILWVYVIDETTRSFVLDSRILEVPACIWHIAFKQWLDDVRRYNGIGLQDEHKDAVVASMLRKMSNLAGRDLESADFAKEQAAMEPSNSCKCVPSGQKRLSAGRWLHEVGKSMNQLIDLIEEQILSGANFRTMEDWWSTRKAWVPSGSSSEKHRVRHLKTTDKRIMSSDRPNKAQTIEAISMDEIMTHLFGQPISKARASTKPEPGFKRRALYASDDISTYIASYASSDLEKCISVHGMVAKQTPEDIMDWMRADLIRRQYGDGVWLSLDYADFNKEHSKQVLYLLNLKLSQMWCRFAKQYSDADIFRDKALCALWTAQSHLNAYCTYPDGTTQRHHSGLWSGHRDTARDNTLLHWCYSDVMKRMVNKYIGLTTNVSYLGICGDDEDALHHNWIGMCAYLGMHRVCKLNLNIHKQLAGRYAHEFLQRQANRNALPMRPIAPMIATLSTGSWYKQSHVYYDTVIPSLSSNAREIIARGANPRYILKVIANMISRMMSVSISTINGDVVNIPLEWWSYRHGGDGSDNNQSLWYGTGNAKPAPEFEELRFMIHKDAIKGAQTDWCNNKAKWMRKMGAATIEMYKRELEYESFKSLYGRFREKFRERLALEQFGTRTNHVGYSLIDKMFDEQELQVAKIEVGVDEVTRIYDMIDSCELEHRPLTMEILLDRLGLDTHLFRHIGGVDGFFELADNADIAKWSNILEYKEMDPPDFMMLVDPAILSWWKKRHYMAN